MKFLILVQVLIIICITNITAQECKRIIHFDKDDYVSPNTPINTDYNGIQGIVAGDQYLVIWNVKEFYIFDIQTYERITTIKTKNLIKQIAILNNKFYVLTDYDNIHIFDISGIINSFRFYSYVRNYQELRKIKHMDEERPTVILEDGTKARKRRRPTNIKKEAPWRNTRIRGIHNIDNQVYLNIDWNYLEFEKDFLHEKGMIETGYDNLSEVNFLFPKEEVIENEYLRFTNYFWKTNRPKWEEHNNFKLEFFNINREKTNTIQINFNDREKGILQNCDPFFMVNNNVIIIGKWINENNNLNILTHKMIVYNTPNNSFSEIVLGEEIINTSVMKRSWHYQTYYADNVYYILYTKNGNFDVLKIKIKT